MALTVTHYTVTTTASKIVSKNTNPQKVRVHNHDHTRNANVFIGRFGVTTSTGFHLQDMEDMQLILNPNDELWAITNTANAILHVMVQEF